MNRLATGLIIGGILGVAGVGYMSTSNSTKRKMMKKGKKAVNKAEHVLDDMSSDMW